MELEINLNELELHHFDCKDASIVYRIIVEGPLLILVLGWPVFGYTWRRVIPILSKHLTCFVLDMLGLGESKCNNKTDIGRSAKAERLVSLTTDSKLSNASILTQNSGGFISRLATLKLKFKLKKY